MITLYVIFVVLIIYSVLFLCSVHLLTIQLLSCYQRTMKCNWRIFGNPKSILNINTVLYVLPLCAKYVFCPVYAFWGTYIAHASCANSVYRQWWGSSIYSGSAWSDDIIQHGNFCHPDDCSISKLTWEIILRMLCGYF